MKCLHPTFYIRLTILNILLEIYWSLKHHSWLLVYRCSIQNTWWNSLGVMSMYLLMIIWLSIQLINIYLTGLYFLGCILYILKLRLSNDLIRGINQWDANLILWYFIVKYILFILILKLSIWINKWSVLRLEIWMCGH